MALSDVIKKGSGAPAPNDLIQGGIGVDILNKKIYIKDSTDAIVDVSAQYAQNVFDSETLTLTNKTIADPTNTVHGDRVTLKVEAVGAIAKGDVVAITGYNGTNLTIDQADNTTGYASGICNDTLADTETGDLVITGLVDALDTDGLAVAAPVYVSTAGGYTTTKPTTGNVQVIGSIGRVSDTFGSILINMVAGSVETALGNPGTSGYILSSDTSGTRSWVAQTSGVTQAEAIMWSIVL